MLVPKRRNADAATTDFGIPDEQAWSEVFATDFYLTIWVNQEAEHVLLTCIEASASIEPFGWWMESVGCVASRIAWHISV